ncbi:feruloyl esterase a [Apiospora marii]|uniref:feruloyl esterase a n=1 Tax=Apiospora marii TaxID=335849 RepID=UPI00312FC450
MIVDQASFDTILHFAKYAGTYSTAPCKKPPQGAAVVAFAQNDTTKTQQTLFRNDGDKEIVLAFPGTIDIKDIGTDINFPQVPHPACDGCAVHEGVYEGWLSVADQTMGQVKDAKQATPNFQFIVVGHSLGGGLANMAFVDMQRAGIKVDRVVTFGELAVGNGKYADHVDSIAGATDDPSKPGMFMRVTHANDGVPLLPPNALTSIIGQDFIQHRTEYWANDGPDGAAPNVSTTFRCYGQGSDACNTGQRGFGINTAHVFYPYVASPLLPFLITRTVLTLVDQGLECTLLWPLKQGLRNNYCYIVH